MSGRVGERESLGPQEWEGGEQQYVRTKRDKEMRRGGGEEVTTSANPTGVGKQSLRTQRADGVGTNRLAEDTQAANDCRQRDQSLLARLLTHPPALLVTGLALAFRGMNSGDTKSRIATMKSTVQKPQDAASRRSAGDKIPCTV
jgi:hypothetical protein